MTRHRIGKDGFVKAVWSGVVRDSEMLFLKGKGRGK